MFIDVFAVAWFSGRMEGVRVGAHAMTDGTQELEAVVGTDIEASYACLYARFIQQV